MATHSSILSWRIQWTEEPGGLGHGVAQLYSTLCDPWTIAYQAPLSMEFSRQKYWSGLPFPSLGDLPDSGIEPVSLVLPASA